MGAIEKLASSWCVFSSSLFMTIICMKKIYFSLAYFAFKGDEKTFFFFFYQTPWITIDFHAFRLLWLWNMFFHHHHHHRCRHVFTWKLNFLFKKICTVWDGAKSEFQYVCIDWVDIEKMKYKINMGLDVSFPSQFQFLSL